MYEALTGDTAVCAVGRDRYWTVLYNTARPHWGVADPRCAFFCAPSSALVRPFAASPTRNTKEKTGIKCIFRKIPKKKPAVTKFKSLSDLLNLAPRPPTTS